VRSAYCYRSSSVVCRSVSRVCHLVSPAKTAEAIEMPFASTTVVGPGKHLLHIADRLGRILYSVYSTHYSLLVSIAGISTTVHLHFNWYRASRGSLGDSWASCTVSEMLFPKIQRGHGRLLSCWCCVCVNRPDEVMLATFYSVWTLVILSAFIVGPRCVAAPTSQRQDDSQTAAAATAGLADDHAAPPLVRST